MMVPTRVLPSRDVALLQTNIGHRLAYAASPLSSSAVTLGDLRPHGLIGVKVIYAVYPEVAAYAVFSIPAGYPAHPPAHRAVRWVRGLGEAALVPDQARTSDAEDAGAAKAMVTEIRQWLSLNVTEVARAIGVERATIYGWLKGAAAMPREYAKRERLQTIYHLAQRWRELAGEPLGSWRQFPILGERSLIDLLVAVDAEEATARPTQADLDQALERLQRERGRAIGAREAGSQARRTRQGALPTDTGEAAGDQLEKNLEWFRTLDET